MRNPRTTLVLAALGLILAASARIASADPQTERGEVLDRVQALEQELAVLKRKLEVQEETAATKPAQPVVGAGSDGFFLSSPDKKYVIKLRGYTQFDSRWFSKSEDTSLPDSFYFRRVRPIVEGTVAGIYDFKLMPDFANSTLVLQDAYVNARFTPEAQLQLGKFKSPFGLERLESATAIWFIERAFPTLLAPNRDLGVMFQGAVREGLATYQFAYLNGNNDTATTDSDVGDDKDFVGRVFVQPFQETSIAPLQGFGIGFATTYGRPEGAPAAIKSITGQTLFQFQSGVTFVGERARYSPQAYWYWGPFALLGEYVLNSTKFERAADTARARSRAWQIAGSWVITGENTSWKGVIPSESFDLETGGLGAFELIARFSRLNLDGDLYQNSTFVNAALYPENADEWAVGLNWYLNRFVKVAFNYEHAEFTNAGSNPNNPSEGAFLTRLQLAY
jgi:phosphate-selective porin OprO/OprP